MGAACAICGRAGAPFGLGAPGPRAEQAPAERGRRLWHCAAPDCAAQAAARWAARFAGRIPRELREGEA